MKNEKNLDKVYEILSKLDNDVIIGDYDAMIDNAKKQFEEIGETTIAEQLDKGFLNSDNKYKKVLKAYTFRTF